MSFVPLLTSGNGSKVFKVLKYKKNWIALTWRNASAIFIKETRGPFLEGPEKFSHPESHSKISKLMITELLYSHILNMKRGSLHTRGFRCIQFSVFRYRWTKNGFTDPKTFRGFRQTGPRRYGNCACTLTNSNGSLKGGEKTSLLR